ncbi:MAG: nitroreductase family protein [bacterium]
MPDRAHAAFLELCGRRRSTRRFSDRPVERAKLEYCIEAARLAPSADNKQPCRWVVLDDAAARTALADAVFGGIYSASRKFAAAPVLAVLLIKENVLVNRAAALVQGTAFQAVDAGIAGEHFVLAATEQELGTCWIGWFDARACTRRLKLRGTGYRPVCLIAVGYPAESTDPATPGQHRRRSADEIAGFNRLPEGK